MDLDGDEGPFVGEVETDRLAGDGDSPVDGGWLQGLGRLCVVNATSGVGCERKDASQVVIEHFVREAVVIRADGLGR